MNTLLQYSQHGFTTHSVAAQHPSPEASPFPVWCYWEGELPPYLQTCLSAIRHTCGQQGFDFTLLTPANLAQFDIQLPTAFANIHHAAQRSDVISAHILYRYGGLFLDADIVFLPDSPPLWDVFTRYSAVLFRNAAQHIAVWAVAATAEHPVIARWIASQNQALESAMKNQPASASLQSLPWNSLGSDALTSHVDACIDSQQMNSGTSPASRSKVAPVQVINATNTVQPVAWHQQAEYFAADTTTHKKPGTTAHETAQHLNPNRQWQRPWQPFLVLNNQVLPAPMKTQPEFALLAQSTPLAALLSDAKQQRRKLILGLGTGRCGTTSLARIFSANHIEASHEAEGKLHWHYQDASQAQRDIQQRLNALLSRTSHVVADCSFFYLPHVEQLITLCHQQNVDIRFVVLQRDRQSTVNSYVKWVGKKNANHWQQQNTAPYTADDWDVCYPGYPPMSLEDAIGRYWDEYYQHTAELAARFPDLVRIFSTQSLNSEAQLANIASFIGEPLNSEHAVAMHENAFNTPVSVYWINLARSTERHTRMSQRLSNSNLAHSAVKAIDAADAKQVSAQIQFGDNPQFLAAHQHKTRDYPVSMAEFCCTASHLKAIAQAFESGAPYAVISEDDVVWTPQACEKIPYLLGRLPKDCVLLQLTSIGPAETLRYLYKYYVDEGRNMVRRDEVLSTLSQLRAQNTAEEGRGVKVECNGTQAYLITKRGMQNLLSQFWQHNQVHFPFPEKVMAGNFGALADEFIYYFAQSSEAYSYVLTRPLLFWDDIDSEIHTDHQPDHQRSYRELLSIQQRPQALQQICPPVYWINRDVSVARRKRMEGRFLRAGIGVEAAAKPHGTKPHSTKPGLTRISAVDGDSPASLQAHLCYHPNATALPSEPREQAISQYELACTASHFKAIQQALADAKQCGTNLALILEDDVELGFLSAQWLEAIINNMPKDCGILQLATLPDTAVEALASWSHRQDPQHTASFVKKSYPLAINTDQLELQHITVHGASAYLITREAMEHLVANRIAPDGETSTVSSQKLCLPVSSQPGYNAAVLADRLIFRDCVTTQSGNKPLSAYTLCHAVTLVEAQNSELHPDHTPSHQRSKQAAMRHILTKQQPLRPDWLKLR